MSNIIKQTLITDYFGNNKVKQKLITDYFVKNNKKLPEKVYGYNEKTDSWHCLTCGEDMGPQNPRQLCGKWYCRNFF
jgi:hypothetical protein